MATLITGGSGFIGLALCEHLLAEGKNVVILDQGAPPAAFLRAIENLPGYLTIRVGSVLDPDALQEAFSSGIDGVFHGAAITAGRERERTDAEWVITVNLVGTLRVLEAARDHGIRRFVYPSSLSVYGESLHDREEAEEGATPPFPESLYGVTKYAGERMVLRLGADSGHEVLCGRIGSVFGPWEVATGVRDLLSPFWYAANRALSGGEIVVPRTPLKRELVYSRDVAAAIARLLTCAEPRFRVYNISAAFDWSRALERWCETLALGLPGVTWREAAEGEIPNVLNHDERPRARQSVRRLVGDLGFTPRFGPLEAFSDYFEWLRAYGRD
jgi:nucleoside-diphosphate-sugar epimerase